MVADKPMMTVQEACEYLESQGLKRSPRTLNYWRSAGQGPVYLKSPTGAIRYTQADLDEWLKSQLVEPDADKAVTLLARQLSRLTPQQIELIKATLQSAEGAAA